MRAWFAAAALVLVVACNPTPQGVALRTADRGGAPSGGLLCPLGQRIPFVIHGDPASPTHVWGEVTATGRTVRFEIEWPAGFRARYAPMLEVLDPSGRVVAREGQTVSDAQGGGDPDFALCGIGGVVYN